MNRRRRDPANNLKGKRRINRKMENSMFCYQCQETAGGRGCTRVGICGKTAETAGLEDLLVYTVKGLAAVAVRVRKDGGEVSSEVNHLITESLFYTITNANFDSDAIRKQITRVLEAKKGLLGQVKEAETLPEAARWEGTPEAYSEKAQAPEVGPLATKDPDIRSFRELITYGLKGLSAYLYHAEALGEESEDVDAFIQRALAQTLDDDLTGGTLLALVMETGRFGLKGMELLDHANTKAYGDPELTKVNLGVGKNPGILISGHDLKDLEMLLEQTKDTGIDVYTHGEMLPAQYYPAFKKYPHFAGNYGNAWWKQKEEFDAFHGPILLTSNCLVPPKEAYQGRLFTTGTVGYPGCVHIEADADGRKDFTPLIEQAKKCDPPKEIETGELVGGFAHHQVEALLDRVVQAVQEKKINKFVVMAGCDGRAKSRSYYTDFARQLPEDTVILTAGCAKYRYNKLGLGDIDGIPRVLDAGQCNDSYSLIRIALMLKEALKIENVNQLPIIYNIAWYEQKAVIVLLALLFLDIKHIHLGPTLPAFLSPAVTNVLVKYFGITPMGTVEKDIESFFGESDEPIRADMIVGDLVQEYPELVPVMMQCGLHCIGCGVSQMETLEEACMTHGLDVYDMMDILNDQLKHQQQ